MGAAAKVLCVFATVGVALAVGQDFEKIRELHATFTSEIQLGIDLGTTQSVAAICAQGNVSVVKVDGSFLTPSVVYFPSSDSREAADTVQRTASGKAEPVVGANAVRQRAQDTGTVIYASKRVIGQQLEDAHAHGLEGLPASLTHDARGRASFRLANDDLVSPELVGALVLKKLKAASESSSALDWLRRTFGFRFRALTVTVPVTFDVDQKAATVRACRMAGFRQVRVIEEPVAAAMAYGLGREKNATRVMVFDIGGGTLDIALLRFNSYSDNFYIESTDGDLHLGGEDFDLALAEFLLGQILDQVTVEYLRTTPHAWQHLLVAAERAKRDLSVDEETSVCIAGAPEGGVEALPVPCKYRIRATREEFEHAAREYLERAQTAILRVMDDARLSLDAIVSVQNMDEGLEPRQVLTVSFPNEDIKQVFPTVDINELADEEVPEKFGQIANVNYYADSGCVEVKFLNGDMHHNSIILLSADPLQLVDALRAHGVPIASNERGLSTKTDEEDMLVPVAVPIADEV
ncbi:Heat shock 70 kDa protein [Hondaea fermentalgiana]|uniref:Heat shock 70 kDa protein n=1 Tax=Hondaea fermentalgiana TaxID=2315210 RepID=A0A2R5GJW2_9STRA|nr:Heat shock 70 kDa protein [Hondaea fermentalgiana]|eukprot:GBG31182.1 Heat shock 70 kDa protein [Hondaea fermentalgiana]